MASAGWYRDPSAFGEGRYWDGTRWTDQVIDAGGITSTFEMTVGADTPPAPGTEYQPPVPVPATPQPVVTEQKSSPVGPILAGLAVVVAIIALVIALANSSDDDGEEEEPTTTTEAPVEPEPTEAPAEPEAE